MKCKTWFQAFAFKWVNLCRYIEVRAVVRAMPLEEGYASTSRNGGAVQSESSCDPYRLKVRLVSTL
jgi:hypothetical protein